MKKLWKTIMRTSGAVSLAYLFSIMPRMVHRADKKPFLGRYYAHRGLYDNASDAPENSLKAFEKAVEAGYGIELDVQLTKDDKLVVFHDFDLKRVCGLNKKVRDLTYAQLKELRLFDSEERIPKFKEVLQLVNGRVPLIIEYKIPGFDAKVCELGDRMLRFYQGVYCVESFNPIGVLWYRLHRNEVFRGILSDSYVKEGGRDMPVWFYEVLHHLLANFIIKPDFIAYNAVYYKDMSRTLCHEIFRAPAVAYTIKSQEQLDARRDDFDIFIFEGFIPRHD